MSESVSYSTAGAAVLSAASALGVVTRLSLDSAEPGTTPALNSAAQWTVSLGTSLIISRHIIHLLYMVGVKVALKNRP